MMANEIGISALLQSISMRLFDMKSDSKGTDGDLTGVDCNVDIMVRQIKGQLC